MGDPSLAPSHVYVLAQICMNASPSNRSREVWKQSVLPQLDYNGEALRKTLAGDAITLPSGAVMYKCDTRAPCRKVIGVPGQRERFWPSSLCARRPIPDCFDGKWTFERG